MTREKDGSVSSQRQTTITGSTRADKTNGGRLLPDSGKLDEVNERRCDSVGLMRTLDCII